LIESKAGGGQADAEAAQRFSFAYYFGERTYSQDAAFFHHGDRGADFLEIGEDMRSDENCLTGLIHFPQEIFQLDSSLGIKAGSRLVKDEERRIVNDGAADAEALFRAAG